MYRGLEHSNQNLSRSQLPTVGHSNGFYPGTATTTNRRQDDALQSALENSSFGMPLDHLPDVSVAEIENALNGTQNQLSSSQYQPRPFMQQSTSFRDNNIRNTPLTQHQQEVKARPFALKPLPSVQDKLNHTMQTPRGKDLPLVPVFPHTVEPMRVKAVHPTVTLPSMVMPESSQLNQTVGLSVATASQAHDKPFTADALYVTTTPHKRTPTTAIPLHTPQPTYQLTVLNNSMNMVTTSSDLNSDSVEQIVNKYRQELQMKKYAEDVEKKKQEQRALLQQQENAVAMQREQLRQQYLPQTPMKIVVEIKSPQKSVAVEQERQSEMPFSSLPLEEALKGISVEPQMKQQHVVYEPVVQKPVIQQPIMQQPRTQPIPLQTVVPPLTCSSNFDDLLAFDTHKLEDAAKRRNQLNSGPPTSIPSTNSQNTLAEKLQQLEKLTSMQKEVESLLHATLAKKDQELRQQRQENTVMKDRMEAERVARAHEELRQAEEGAHNASGFMQGQLIAQQQSLSDGPRFFE